MAATWPKKMWGLKKKGREKETFGERNENTEEIKRNGAIFSGKKHFFYHIKRKFVFCFLHAFEFNIKSQCFVAFSWVIVATYNTALSGFDIFRREQRPYYFFPFHFLNSLPLSLFPLPPLIARSTQRVFSPRRPNMICIFVFVYLIIDLRPRSSFFPTENVNRCCISHLYDVFYGAAYWGKASALAVNVYFTR